MARRRKPVAHDAKIVMAGSGGLVCDTDQYIARQKIEVARRRFRNEENAHARAGKLQKSNPREVLLQAVLTAELAVGKRPLKDLLRTVNEKLKAGGHKPVSQRTLERRLRLRDIRQKLAAEIFRHSLRVAENGGYQP